MRKLVVLVVLVLATGGCSVLDRGDNGGEGSKGSILRLALVRPSSLDPIKARTVDEQVIAEQLFDTLVTLDSETGEPGPGLAASWATSEDGLQWDFTLRDDATFSNGDAVTAADVKATLDRAAGRDSGSAVADLLEPVAGWRAVAVDGTTTELAGVTATSDAVVHITLDAPWSTLPVALAQPSLGIVPRAAARAATFEDKPVGSGPFVVGEHDRRHLVLQAAKGRRLRLDGIDIALFDDQEKAYDAFARGGIDWSPVPLARADEAAARYGRKYFRSYVAELYYAFNLRNPKWADRRVREAVVRAIDSRKIIDDVYSGTMRPMTSFAVAGIPGAPSDSCADLCTHDVERAKALLADVAATGGSIPPVSIDFEGDAAQLAVAAHIERDLEAVGFDVTTRPKGRSEYERFAVSGEQDLFRLGWIAAYPAGDAFVAPVFSSGSANNLPGFAVSAVDDLIRQARASADPAARAAALEQAERAIFAEVPIVPIGQFQQHWVARQRVRGLELSVSGTFDAASVWLAGD